MANENAHPKKAAFLAAYAQCGVITRACEASDVGRTTVHEWKRDDPKFAAAMAEAVEEATERLEAEAIRRGSLGWEEPVFHQGEVCGTVRKFSDTLLIFTLKALKPSKYRDNYSIEHSGPNGGPIQLEAKTAAQKYMGIPEAVCSLEEAEKAVERASG